MDVPLNFNRQGSTRFEREGPEESFAISEAVEQLSGFVRRQFPIFVFITSCCLALGLVYLFTTPPSFTSHAMLLIDSSKLRILQQQEAPVADVPIDAAQVETQVEILKSENIGLSVVKDLKLAEDHEFVGSGSGLLGWITGLFSSAKLQSDAKLDRAALGSFLAKRKSPTLSPTLISSINCNPSIRLRDVPVPGCKIVSRNFANRLPMRIGLYWITKRRTISWLSVVLPITPGCWVNSRL
jgi:polysaccharide biosynthesis transport protein